MFSTYSRGIGRQQLSQITYSIHQFWFGVTLQCAVQVFSGIELCKVALQILLCTLPPSFFTL